MRRSSQLALTAAASALALAVAGCGSSSHTVTHTIEPTGAVVSKAAPASQGTGIALSGRWTGQYSGAYSGTFALNWQELGSSLNGRITLSAPPGTLGINGHVAGSAIKFGTVGGGVLYSGSIRGNSMSGDYQTPNGGGSWSASKS